VSTGDNRSQTAVDQQHAQFDPAAARAAVAEYVKEAGLEAETLYEALSELPRDEAIALLRRFLRLMAHFEVSFLLNASQRS
jgi:DNA-directed RNA polymerase specialized sigma24 family protein